MLDAIEIGINGSCQSCIYPDIPSEILEYEKEKLRNKYEKEN